MRVINIIFANRAQWALCTIGR